MSDVIAWLAAGVSLLLGVGRIWIAGKLWSERALLPPDRRPHGYAILLAMFIVGLLGLVIAGVLIVSVTAPDSLRGLRWLLIVVLGVGFVMAVPGIIARIRFRRDRELTDWLLLRARPSSSTG